jgi:lambda family phage minor tail protein L
MGQGQNKIASSLLDIQPTAVLEFFRIYPDTVVKPDVFIPIHGGSVFGNNVTWQNVEYIPMPIESEGFEINGNGQLSRPKMRIANKDYLITNLLQNNFDFKNAKIVRKRTFLKYLDDVNFEGGNPFGSQDFTAEISIETFLVGQKTAENKVYVEFELTSPLDLENFEVTNRQILAKYCYWGYRSHGCNYVGGPLEKEDGFNFIDASGVAVIPVAPIAGFLSNSTYRWDSTREYNKTDIAYLENPKVIINKNPLDNNSYSGPLRTWYVCIADKVTNQNPQSNPTYWQKDGCSKKISACKKRFVNIPLPFGGFPGTDGFNYGG